MNLLSFIYSVSDCECCKSLDKQDITFRKGHKTKKTCYSDDSVMFSALGAFPVYQFDRCKNVISIEKCQENVVSNKMAAMAEGFG